jgi:hypothetical protein
VSDQMRHDLPTHPTQPESPGPATTNGAFAPVPAAPARRAKRRQLIVLSVFLVAVVAFFGFVYAATRHNPGTAKAGDCVRQTGADAVQVVDCADARAQFTVVGRVENKTEVEAGLDACEPFADLGATQAFWSGQAGKTGYVLCLAKTS